jgi:hypothetical protein
LFFSTWFICSATSLPAENELDVPPAEEAVENMDFVRIEALSPKPGGMRGDTAILIEELLLPDSDVLNL